MWVHREGSQDVWSNVQEGQFSFCHLNGSRLSWGFAELGLCDDSLALYFQIEEEVVENLWGMLGLIQIGEVVHSNFGTMGLSSMR